MGHTTEADSAAESGEDLFISGQELRPRVEARDSRLVLVDVLSRDSYEITHIPGAISFPYADMTEPALLSAFPDLDAEIVVYCGGDT